MSITMNEALPQAEVLTVEEQYKMIAEAIQKTCPSNNLNTWGTDCLFQLLNYHEDNAGIGTGIPSYSKYFTDLLLFLAEPEISETFHKKLGKQGLAIIRNLVEFFHELGWLASYDEWLDYQRLTTYGSIKKEEILWWAKKYLPESGRLRIEAAHEDPYKAKLEAIEKEIELRNVNAAGQVGIVSEPESKGNGENAPPADQEKSRKPAKKRLPPKKNSKPSRLS